MASNSFNSTDSIDVADVAATVRRQWRAVVAFLALGVLAALAVVLFAPRRFDGKVTVLARPAAASGGSVSGRMSGIGELLGSLGGLGLPGSVETELQLLKSRAVIGEVVDSLQLQFVVVEPEGLAPSSIVASSAINTSFAPRTYQFEGTPGGGYRASGEGAEAIQLQPGVAGSIGVGTITLRNAGLPSRFELRVLDREDAITRVGKRLSASKAGGDVLRVVYRGDDSASAAAAANSIVKFYLERRRTTDRGVNQRRVEYVTAQLDSVGVALHRAEADLRKQQESSRVLDAEIVGQVELEAAAELRKSLTDLQVEEGAIRQLLAQADAGRISSRALSAYPTFIRGSAVTPLAQQLNDLEGQRIRLLERRTERDPEVQGLDQTITLVQSNIAAMARSYAASVSRQREELEARVDSIQRTLLALPAAAQQGGRLQRDVLRLSQIYAALEAQLIDARLAAIGEGGEVRQIDVAVPSRKPAFPQPVLTMGIGTAGGLLMGLIAALVLGWFGRWLRDPTEIERAVGINAQRLDADAPLLVAAPSAQSVLVVGLDGASDTTSVAERLLRTARQRALNATVLDLGDRHLASNGKPAVDTARVGTLIDDLEREHGAVIVQVPTLFSDTTLAALRSDRPVVLVAPPGPVDRTRLAQAVDTLRRLQVPCAGVVISEPANRARALL